MLNKTVLGLLNITRNTVVRITDEKTVLLTNLMRKLNKKTLLYTFTLLFANNQTIFGFCGS